MKNKKATGILLTICVMLLMSTSGIVLAVSPNEDPVSTNVDTNAIVTQSVTYNHASVLNVKETITNMGGGTYKYSYEFTNTEKTSIWQFMVWTTFNAGTSTQTTFAQTPTWTADGHDISSVSSDYDARNLNPNIKWLSHTWASGYPTPTDGIAAGKYVSGFSFTANVYDPSPKYYGYDLYGEGSSGAHSAVGLTGATPTISISTDKTAYTPGQTINLKINITNPTSNKYSSSVVLVILPPTVPTKTLGQKSFSMTPNFNVEKVVPIKLPTSIAKGTYKFTATLTYNSTSVSSSTSFTI